MPVSHHSGSHLHTMFTLFFLQGDRDVGGTDMSSTAADMKIQAKKTNSRLERGGLFKLA